MSSNDIDISAFGLATNWFQPVLMQRAHRHNEVELNFIEQGSLTYLFGGMRTSLQAGQMALFWATVPHQLMLVEERTILHWLTIPFATFLRWQLPDMLTRQVICGKFVTDPEEGDAARRQANQVLFRQWYADLQQNSPEHRKIVLLEVEARLHRLALSMSMQDGEAAQQESSRSPLPVGEPSNVERLACFIAEHYTEPLSVEQIAQTVHLHPNYVMSLFRRSFGMSIIDYITQYRVSHAQFLLITTDMNVSEIALKVGFGSISRFYTAFKEVCGQSPVAYRASLRKVGTLGSMLLNETKEAGTVLSRERDT
jgi:AraC family transcriptional regulator, melibiose operon regulatory protein